MCINKQNDALEYEKFKGVSRLLLEISYNYNDIGKVRKPRKVYMPLYV